MITHRAAPYPSTIVVAGMPGAVTKVTVKLNDITHGNFAGRRWLELHRKVTAELKLLGRAPKEPPILAHC